MGGNIILFSVARFFFSFGLYVWDLSYRYCFIFYSLLPGFFFFSFWFVCFGFTLLVLFYF